MTFVPREINVQVFQKGSKIFCTNGHCCAYINHTVPENATLEQLLDVIVLMDPHQKTENGLPTPKCAACGGDILYALPRTIH